MNSNRQIKLNNYYSECTPPSQNLQNQTHHLLFPTSSHFYIQDLNSLTIQPIIWATNVNQPHFPQIFSSHCLPSPITSSIALKSALPFLSIPTGSGYHWFVPWITATFLSLVSLSPISLLLSSAAKGIFYYAYSVTSYFWSGPYLTYFYIPMGWNLTALRKPLGHWTEISAQRLQCVPSTLCLPLPSLLLFSSIPVCFTWPPNARSLRDHVIFFFIFSASTKKAHQVTAHWTNK